MFFLPLVFFSPQWAHVGREYSDASWVFSQKDFHREVLDPKYMLSEEVDAVGLKCLRHFLLLRYLCSVSVCVGSELRVNL